MARKTTDDKTSENGFALLRRKETNGDNYDISTDDIIARLTKCRSSVRSG